MIQLRIGFIILFLKEISKQTLQCHIQSYDVSIYNVKYSRIMT